MFLLECSSIIFDENNSKVGSEMVLSYLNHLNKLFTCITCITGISCIAYITCITCLTCITDISHQLISWDITDIAGILIPQKYLSNIVRVDWLSLIINDNHCDYHTAVSANCNSVVKSAIQHPLKFPLKNELNLGKNLNCQ